MEKCTSQMKKMNEDNEKLDSRENKLLLSADVDLGLNVLPYFSQVG